jgi:Domain of unknown function (DUF2017)
VRRSRRGSYEISLSTEDREVLRALPTQLRDAIAANPKDEAFRRLFPPAYANDPEADEEYRQMVGPELDERRSVALDTLAKTADATELTEEELEAWLRALNDIRLWLGTLLDVSEDEAEQEPEDPPHMLYHALTALQSMVIDVLSGEG